MTMIRINLIAERKAGAAKPVKKQATQANALQEYLILIVCVAIAIGVAWTMKTMTAKELRQRKAEETKLKAEYAKLEHWEKKKLDYELQKELLLDQIKQISELKDNREGPVKLLEDLNNILPEQVWLDSITQGHDEALTQAFEPGREDFKPASKFDKNRVIVEGRSSSQEAITNFANQLLSLDQRYQKHDLNVIAQDVQKAVPGQKVKTNIEEYKFVIYFDLSGVKPSKAAETESKETKKKKKGR